MAEETRINDLKSLSQSWSERVKNIRQMAKDDDVACLAEDVVQSSSLNGIEECLGDDELFVGSVGQELTAKEIFSGDEEFYKSIGNTLTAVSGVSDLPISSLKSEPKESTFLTKILAVALILTVFVVLSYGVFLNLTSLENRILPSKNDDQQTVATRNQVNSQPQEQQFNFQLDAEHPISLGVARDYHRKAEYLKACAVYERLIQNLSRTADNDALRDYLQLNMALCLQETNDGKQAVELLKKISLSCSPLVRIYSNYYLCLFERDTKQFLAERTRAYRAIGLLDTMDIETDWSRNLRRDLYFLAAEAITRESLSLADTDGELPGKLWPSFNQDSVPLIHLNESDLYKVLNAGSSELNKALMRPQIQEDNTEAGKQNWMVISNTAPIGELMGRISSNINHDILWQTDSEKTNMRENSVSLCLSAVNEQDMVTIAAGTVGLLASVNENNSFVICNPAEYSSVSEQLSLLSNEAVLCWQNYLMKFEEDRYFANVYFALGSLKALQGQAAASVSQYKMVSGRYSNSPLGPYALVCSSRLKDSLHDYQGAYEDLKDAVEQYPDQERIDLVYLALAAAAEKINYTDEAAKLYCKVYYLNNSAKSQSDAAFAAGKLFYNNEDYKDAEKWLTVYIELTKDEEAANLHQACLYLGKIWSILNKTNEACEALQVALQGRLSQQDYVETITTLVESYMAKERFIEALSILNDTTSRQLSQTESVQMLLLKSSALRGVGLTDKAIGLLAEREAYVIDDVLKNQIRYELSECYIEQNQLNLAYRKLAEILEETGYASLEYKTACRLTDVCLRLGMDAEALSIGSQLLTMDPPEAIKHETSELLATVYNKQKNYDLAAMVLMGQSK